MGFVRTASTLGALLLSVPAPSASAEDYRLAVGAGVFDPLGSGTTGMLSVMLEGPAVQSIWSIRPALVGFALERSGYYLGIGGHKEFSLAQKWHWGVATGLGYYHQGAERNELGYDIEFYSRISISYQLSSRQAVRAEFGHISNADLGEENPGSETATLSWISHF
ncbi:acyloxyacyl hydrolase [Aestuariirhabdus litorea]|uniref:Acyloxyacyl hydrolase n=1 Tax=Aestuariirhabdus litorea TaxID=2528527 RepID=A0A3P3VJZ0_9GAMM|nr:acyloxyacyl hydrolase [Aestuariirhabdus litorea]RRJ82637.1 hypothetical protein D0544_12295 [Aestuariirhabdus litorea]RWW92798.1 hypothetical protein DZC74_12275 [Endozoicomonadaceae bacterium GTF-13]